MKSGFTLIEMSIVLVIIGLIVGGILTGQDLITAATIRAQISQIEKYNTAVRTFQSKYGYLPGDIPDPIASNFGFISRGSFAGQGDGNGILEGNGSDAAAGNNGTHEGDGELAVFWVDLSTAGLIDGTIKNKLAANYPNSSNPGTVQLTSTPAIKDWLPAAKLGNGNFVYVFSLSGVNYYAFSSVFNIGWTISANPGTTVLQAYSIDSKIDDGLPQSGGVSACYVNNQVLAYQAVWAAGNNLQGANGGSNCKPTTAATIPLTTDCYGNNNSTGVMQYSVTQNANLLNCVLSFKFQ